MRGNCSYITRYTKVYILKYKQFAFIVKNWAELLFNSLILRVVMPVLNRRYCWIVQDVLFALFMDTEYVSFIVCYALSSRQSITQVTIL